MMKGLKGRVFFGGIVTLSTVLFLMTIILSLFFLSHVHEENIADEKEFLYKYVQLHKDGRGSSVGLISTPQEINDGYGVVPLDEVLILSFGEQEYLCTGSCSCENDGYERRAASSTIFRGATLLVSSVSTFLAYQKAKNHFEEECSQALSADECSYSAVRSKVDKCESLFPEFDSELEKIERKKQFEQTHHKYWCKGFCVENSKFKKEITRNLAREFNCIHLMTDATLFLKEKRVKRDQEYYDNEAKELFSKRHLKEYCRDNSRTSFFKEVDEDETREGGRKKYGYWNTVILCIGNNVETPQSNIHCVFIPKGLKSDGNQLLLDSVLR